MRKFTLVLTLVISAAEQQSATSNPVSEYLRMAFAAVSTDFIAAAEIMPNDAYGFKPPGTAPEVRTFAQLIGHTAEVYSFVCAAAQNERDPLIGVDGDTIKEKARLVQMLKDAVAYCTNLYRGLTDASLSKMVVMMGTDGVGRMTTPANAAVFNIAHANEHYGNVVTYLRVKGLVPPATPPQAGWRAAR